MTTSQLPSARLRPFRPQPFGRYTLLAELAKGGMGEIFLARMEGPQGFEKLCVIKKILPQLAEDHDFVQRFVNEAKTVVKLTHGSIAQVLDMGVHEGEPFLALEHVDGKDLRKIAARMRDRQVPTPLTVVLYVMSRVLDALAYAHRKRDDEEREIGLVHRDISPQNVLVSYEGEVKVIDFGLAKSTLHHAKTNPSIILGKFLYMSPEQARHSVVDRRSDLYAVGVCLYELIHGKNPFDAVPAGELMANVANPRIPPLSQVEPLCPPSVAAVVTRALQVDPAQRFQTAEEFRGKLLSCLLDIDPSAGPESVSRFMREAFAQEYQTERRMLASLREALREAAAPARAEPPRATLRPEVTPVVSRLRPPVRGEADRVTEHDVPLLRGSPPPRPNDELTLPRAPMPEKDTDPRALLPPSREVDKDTQPRAAMPLGDTDPRARPPMLPPPPVGMEVTHPRAGLPARDDATLPRVELADVSRDTQPRVLLGTLLPEGEVDLPEPRSTVYMEPPHRPVTPAGGMQPTVQLPPYVPEPPPSSGRSGWLLVVPIVLFTLAAVTYFLYDMYRDGAFLADPPPASGARPSDLREVAPVAVGPQPGMPAASDLSDAKPIVLDQAVAGVVPANAAGGTATEPASAATSDSAAAEDIDLEPLTPAPAAKKPAAPTKRRASTRSTPLTREWSRARAAFEELERGQPCETPSMALLCTRYAALKSDVEGATAADTEKLLARIRSFAAAVELKRRR